MKKKKKKTKRAEIIVMPVRIRTIHNLQIKESKTKTFWAIIAKIEAPLFKREKYSATTLQMISLANHNRETAANCRIDHLHQCWQLLQIGKNIAVLVLNTIPTIDIIIITLAICNKFNSSKILNLHKTNKRLNHLSSNYSSNYPLEDIYHLMQAPQRRLKSLS